MTAKEPTDYGPIQRESLRLALGLVPPWFIDEVKFDPEQQRLDIQTAEAYEFKLQFQDFWSQDPDAAPYYLDDWCNRVFVTDMPAHEPLLRFVGTVDQHWDGIVRWFQSRVNNGMLEAINGLIQTAKRRARGYRTTRYLIDMVYLISGKLTLPDFHRALTPAAAATHAK